MRPPELDEGVPGPPPTFRRVRYLKPKPKPKTPAPAQARVMQKYKNALGQDVEAEVSLLNLEQFDSGLGTKDVTCAIANLEPKVFEVRSRFDLNNDGDFDDGAEEDWRDWRPLPKLPNGASEYLVMTVEATPEMDAAVEWTLQLDGTVPAARLWTANRWDPGSGPTIDVAGYLPDVRCVRFVNAALDPDAAVGNQVEVQQEIGGLFTDVVLTRIEAPYFSAIADVDVTATALRARFDLDNDGDFDAAGEDWRDPRALYTSTAEYFLTVAPEQAGNAAAEWLLYYQSPGDAFTAFRWR